MWQVDQWALSDEDDTRISSTLLAKHYTNNTSAREVHFGSKGGYKGVPTMDAAARHYGSESPQSVHYHRQKIETIKARVHESTSPWVLHPLSTQVLTWNVVMLIMVTVSVFLAPYEAAFVDNPAPGLKAVNIVLDAMFLLDMVLQPFIAALDPSTQTLVFNQNRVVWNYIYGPSFPADIVSVLPISLFWDLCGPFRWSELLRRTSLLLKLARVVRVPRLLIMYHFKRGFSYGSKTLVKSFWMVVTVAHIMGCCWGLVGRYGPHGGSDPTWLDIPQSAGKEESFRELESWALYVACLYWAVFTLTGIGYGDIYPQTRIERAVSVGCMLAGALTWAVVVANIISIVGIWSAADAIHEVRMDELEELMEERRFNGALRIQLREYFRKRAFHLDKVSRLRLTIQQMSPKLAAQAIEALYGKLFRSIFWLRGVMDDPSSIHGPFIIMIADRLESQLYCPAEAIAIRQAVVMMVYGTAILRGEGVVVSGSIWGEDMLLDNPSLRRASSAMSLTFVEIGYLRRGDLDEVMEDFPLAKTHIRHHKARLALIRGIVFAAEEERKKQSRMAQDPTKKGETAMLKAMYIRRQTSVGVADGLKASKLAGLSKLGQPAFVRQSSMNSTTSRTGMNRMESRMGQMEVQLDKITDAIQTLSSKMDLMSSHHEESEVSSACHSEEHDSVVFQQGADPSILGSIGEEEVVCPSGPASAHVSPRTLKAFSTSIPSRMRA